MTERSYITIAHADSPAEADLLRIRLAAGGVAAVVRDDHLVRLNPILAGVVGGIRVDVLAEQAAIAREVLSDNGLAAHTEDESNAAVPTVACRHCGALGHARSSRSFVAKFSAALLSTLSLAGGVPRAVSDPARCAECGKET